MAGKIPPWAKEEGSLWKKNPAAFHVAGCLIEGQATGLPQEIDEALNWFIKQIRPGSIIIFEDNLRYWLKGEGLDSALPFLHQTIQLYKEMYGI